MASVKDNTLLHRPRPYQLELYQQARQRNIVAYLDTGSGKTLVSVLLIQDFATELVEISSKDILNDVSVEPEADGAPAETGTAEEKTDSDRVAENGVVGASGQTNSTQPSPIAPSPLQEIVPGVHLPEQPKKVVFLVPTVPLVAQQAAKIRENTDFVVGEYSREDIVSVAYWDIRGWYYELSQRQVLVFTPQIFLNILTHGFLKLSRDVSLLIIDECHHAVKQHPYNLMMREFYHSIPSNAERPKVFGMTASPIYQKTITRDESKFRLQELESNLDCKVVTVTDRSSLGDFIPRASETVVEYLESADRDFTYANPVNALEEVMQNPSLSQSTRCYHFWMARLTEEIQNSRDDDAADAADRLVRSQDQIRSMKIELGPWLAGKAAQEQIRALSHRRRGQANPKAPTKASHGSDVLAAGNETSKWRNACAEMPSLSEITQNDITPKVHTLLRLLEERAQNATEGASFRAMIFVERRLSAKVLSEFLNLVATTRFPVVKCAFVTGHGASKSGKTAGRSAMNVTYQKRTFDRFRKGDMNTLVVTRVAEEGLDIPACKLIIVFDIFRSHTGYVQSRGRARDLDGSEYLIMVQRNDMHALRTVARAKVAEVMTQDIAQELSGQASQRQIVAGEITKTDIDDNTTELLLGAFETPLRSKAGAIISASGATTLLHRYCALGSLQRKELAAFYSLEFDHQTGTYEQWRAYVNDHLYGSVKSDNTTDGPKSPYGYAYAFRFPASTPLSNEVVYGPIRGTKKLAQQSVALAACKRLYDVGALNEHLLPNLQFKKKPGAFSLPALLQKWRLKMNIDPEVKSAILATEEGSREIALADYPRDVPSVFGADQAWTRIGLDVGSSLPSTTMEPTPFYVTMISLGPEIDSEIRSQPGDPHADFIRETLSAIPGSDTRTLPSYRRSFAILTTHPIPTSDIPKFALWLGGERTCQVELLAWDPNQRPGDESESSTAGVSENAMEEDENEDEEHHRAVHPPRETIAAKAVLFSPDELESIVKFQKTFWHLASKHSTPLGRPLNSSLGKRKRDVVEAPIAEDQAKQGVEEHASLPVGKSEILEGVAQETNGPSATHGPSIPTTPVQPLSDARTSEPRKYMILPVRGIPLHHDEQTTTVKPADETTPEWMMSLDPPRCEWVLDWPMIRRLADEEFGDLYVWMVLLSRMMALAPNASAGSTVENNELRVAAGTEGYDRLGTVSVQEQGAASVLDDDDKVCGLKRKRVDGEEWAISKRQAVEKASAFDVLFTQLQSLASNSVGIENETFDQRPEILEKITTILKELVIHTPHSNVKYTIEGINLDMHPTAKFDKQKLGNTVTFLDYVTKQGYTVRHPDTSGMIEARHAPNVHNLLRPSKRITHGLPPKETAPSTHKVFLVPEACKVLPFPRDIYRMADIFPSILHKLDVYCTIDEFRKNIGLPVTNETLLAAFSSPSAQEMSNYERLETLGDSFLKYAVSMDLFKRFADADEGFLSTRRSRIVSNRNLFKIALKHRLFAVMNVTPFNPRSWVPPWTAQSNNHRRLNRGADPKDEDGHPFASAKGPWWRQISQKMLADFLEALIGAYYTDSGNDVALMFLHRFGLVSDAVISPTMLCFEDRHVKDGQSGVKDLDGDLSPEEGIMEAETKASPEGRQPSLSQYRTETMDSLKAVEQNLKYRFNNRSLLMQALTHGSAVGAGSSGSYQRLEYLGDAVLDWVLTRFFFNSYPHLSPSALTDLRQAAVNNESFSRMAALLELHKSLRHDAPGLHEEIATYVKYLGSLDKSAHPIETAMGGPKVLGDLFEAVAGAVFIDSGCNLEVMWTVFKPLMIDFLEIHANPDVVTKSPIRQLQEFFQRRGFAVNDVTYSYEIKCQTHHCELRVLDELIGVAEANSQQLAKRLATLKGLSWLTESEEKIAVLLQTSQALRD